MPALDGLRACAVAAVFLLHLDQPHFPGGAVGVDVFFVISAYLITGLLLKRSGELHPYRNFYWRRVFRLYPALVLFVVLAAVTAIAAGQGRRAPLAVVGSLLYVNDLLMAFTHRIPTGFGQTWSLAVEEQFYLVWAPMLLLGVSRLRRNVQLGSLVAVAAIGFAFLFVHTNWNYFLPTGHLFGLALGCIAAWARHEGWSPPCTERRLICVRSDTGCGRGLGSPRVGDLAALAGVARCVGDASDPRHRSLS